MNSEILLEKLHREGIQIASIQKRGLAYLIDELLISLVLFIVHYDEMAIIFPGNDLEQTVKFINSMMIELVILRFIYQAFFTAYYGASIGKIWLKISCFDIELMSKPNIWQSCLRAFLRGIGELIMFVSFLWAFADGTRRTLHDLLAKTAVRYDY